VQRHLEARGYRVWVAPDGRDFLDLVARRGPTVGLVELKVADWRTVRAQGIVRRALGDWVAVALPSASLAQRLVDSLRGPVAPRLGVWVVTPGGVEELREAQPMPDPPDGTPAAEARRRFRALLDRVEELPQGVDWGGAARRTGTGRSYRLDEFPTEGAEGTRPESSATRRAGA
jgi:hypothetical protein